MWVIYFIWWKWIDVGGYDSYLKGMFNLCFVKVMREVVVEVWWIGMDFEKDFDVKCLNNSLNYLRFGRWIFKLWNFDDFEI